MPPAKARRWTRRPDERPQELLDAAIEVFTTHGYRAARLEQVAEAAGVTKGAIYHHFRSKEELLTQALHSRIGAIFGGVAAEGRSDGRTAVARLRAVLFAAWQRWCRPESARMYRLLMGEVRTALPELFDAALRAGPLHAWRLVAGIIEEGQRSGEFEARVDPQAAARFIVSGLVQQALLLTEMRERGLDGLPPEDLFEAAFAVVLHGVAPAAPVAPVAPSPARRAAGVGKRRG